MWDRAGEIVYPASAGSGDKVMEAAIEAGADDVVSEEEGHTITCAFENIGEVSKAMEAALGEAESVKIIWQPQNNVPVDEERAQSLMKLVATLEDDDDVQNVYANFEGDEATMAKPSEARERRQACPRYASPIAPSACGFCGPPGWRRNCCRHSGPNSAR